MATVPVLYILSCVLWVERPHWTVLLFGCKPLLEVKSELDFYRPNWHGKSSECEPRLSFSSARTFAVTFLSGQ